MADALTAQQMRVKANLDWATGLHLFGAYDWMTVRVAVSDKRAHVKLVIAARVKSRPQRELVEYIPVEIAEHSDTWRLAVWRVLAKAAVLELRDSVKDAMGVSLA